MSATPTQVPARKDRAKIIGTIKKLVSERHINVSNPNQDYNPWISLIDQQTPRLMEVEREAFEAGVSELLKALGSSHTAFFHQRRDIHQRRDSIPAPYSINATLRPVETVHGKRWMFVDVIEDGVAFQAGIRPGEFLLSIDSEPIVPPKSANFRIGGNHHVEIAGFNGNKRKVTIGVPNRAAKDQINRGHSREYRRRLRLFAAHELSMPRQIGNRLQSHPPTPAEGLSQRRSNAYQQDSGDKGRAAYDGVAV